MTRPTSPLMLAMPSAVVVPNCVWLAVVPRYCMGEPIVALRSLVSKSHWPVMAAREEKPDRTSSKEKWRVFMKTEKRRSELLLQRNVWTGRPAVRLCHIWPRPTAHQEPDYHFHLPSI